MDSWHRREGKWPEIRWELLFKIILSPKPGGIAKTWELWAHRNECWGDRVAGQRLNCGSCMKTKPAPKRRENCLGHSLTPCKMTNKIPFSQVSWRSPSFHFVHSNNSWTEIGSYFRRMKLNSKILVSNVCYIICPWFRNAYLFLIIV